MTNNHKIDEYTLVHDYEVARGRSMVFCPTQYDQQRFPGTVTGLLDAYRAFREMIRKHSNEEIVLNMRYDKANCNLYGALWIRTLDHHGIKTNDHQTQS